MISRRRLLAAAASAPIVFAGCRVRTINYFPPSDAHVRFANFTLDSAGMDVREGDSTIWSGVAFEGSTDFVDFTNERKTFGLYVTGQSEELANAEVTLAGEQSYTLLSYGSTDLTNALLAPDASPNAGNDNFLIRIIDVASGLPAFDAYFTDPTIPIDENIGPNFVNLQSGTSTVALRFTVGTYSLRIAIAGSRSVVYDSGPRTFGGGLSTDFVLFTLGSASLPQVSQLDVNDGGQRVVLSSTIATVRIVNGAVQTGAIDATVAGTAVANGLAYATSSLYTFATAGTNLISVQATSTPGAPIATLQAELPSARESSVIVLGLAGAVRMVAFVDDNRSPLSNQARARFVNASSDAAAYDVYVGDTKQFSALVPGTASAYLVLDAGTATVTFRDPGTGAVALTVADVAFGEGRVLTIYAVGTAGALTSVVNTDR